LRNIIDIAHSAIDIFNVLMLNLYLRVVPP